MTQHWINLNNIIQQFGIYFLFFFVVGGGGGGSAWLVYMFGVEVADAWPVSPSEITVAAA